MAVTPGTLSPAARILFGLLFVACGLIPALAAFDVGPFQSSDINGPPWIGLAAGGIFIAAGIAVMLGDRLQNSSFAYGLVALILGSLAMIANWVSFGSGPRACTAEFAGVYFESGSIANDISCRAAFGIGAVLLDGVVLTMAARALREIGAPGWLPTLVEKLGIGLMLLALAPIILPLLLVLIAKSCLEAFITWRKTGEWPRNESFIQRMKARMAPKPETPPAAPNT
jgi:hypothetical protein